MPFLFDIDIALWDLVGLSGAAFYVAAYVLAALDMLPSQNWRFYFLNLVAGGLVLAGLLGGDFNLASAVIQVFYAGVSIVGLTRHRSRRQRERRQSRALRLGEEPA